MQHEEADDAEDEYIAAAAAMGLQPEQAGDLADDQVDASTPEVFYLWLCNVSTWNIWHQLQTQWHKGPEGRTGLDYPGVGFYLREVAGVKPRHFAEVFGCLQAMERASLEEFSKLRE